MLHRWRGLLDFKILKETFNVLKKSNKIFNPATWDPPVPIGEGMCPSGY
jgi:hypothetical protein